MALPFWSAGRGDPVECRSVNSRRNSVLLGPAVVVVAAGLFIALRPNDSEETPAATQSETPAKAETAIDVPSAAVEPEKPAVPRIVIRNGEPVGGVLGIDVKKGDRIRFKVKSDVEEEIHVHGFDISEDVAPGETASLDFDADFTGIFEAELEFSGVPIAEIQVNP